MPEHNVIVIGASAGGVEALRELVRPLPPDIPAAIFIVLHIAPNGTSLLPQILSRAGKLPAFTPLSRQVIEHGNIYIAPPDHHLPVKDGHVLLTKGPRENGFRPSIDSLFRTAANAYGSHAIAVMLTGLLDNGSAGMVVVKAKGGLTVVQDPRDAMFPSMPESALSVIEPDYVLPLAKIPEMLVQLAEGLLAVPYDEHLIDVDTAETAEAEYIYHENKGKVAEIVCPECGGVLVEYQHGANGHLNRFECRVGHRYSLESLAEVQQESTENALWAAVRALEERRTVAQRMVEYAREINDPINEQVFENRLREADQHADIIRQLLLGKNGRSK